VPQRHLQWAGQQVSQNVSDIMTVVLQDDSATYPWFCSTTPSIPKGQKVVVVTTPAVFPWDFAAPIPTQNTTPDVAECD